MHVKTLITSVALLLAAPIANADAIFVQDFESGTAGWFDADNGWNGSIEQEASGTGGITSFDGSFHARVQQSNGTAPYSNYSGINDGTDFPDELSVRTAIYLDTDMLAGEGFDYSTALNAAGGGFLRDFIFHVAKDISTGSLLVGGSNNTNFDPRQDLENGNFFEVVESGWYIFEHLFRNEGGFLVGDLNLYNAVGNLLFTESRDGNGDLFSSAGEARYSWFTNVDVTGGIAIDAFSLNATEVPVPAPLGLLGVGLLAVAGLRRRRAT